MIIFSGGQCVCHATASDFVEYPQGRNGQLVASTMSIVYGNRIGFISVFCNTSASAWNTNDGNKLSWKGDRLNEHST
jgi:hypothetical protein